MYLYVVWHVLYMESHKDEYMMLEEKWDRDITRKFTFLNKKPLY